MSQDLSRHIKERQNCVYSLDFEIKYKSLGFVSYQKWQNTKLIAIY